MNIYKVIRDEPIAYDTYDSFVIIAPDETTARQTHPTTTKAIDADIKWDHCNGCWSYFDGAMAKDYCWTNDIKSLAVTLIGAACDCNQDSEVVVSSFNAG